MPLVIEVLRGIPCPKDTRRYATSEEIYFVASLPR